MRFQNIAHAVAFTTCFVTSIVIPDVLTDGTYSITHPEDGTTITTSLNNPDLAPIITYSDPTSPASPVLKARFAWENGDCWGYQLDHYGVDQALYHLGEWAGIDGHELCSPQADTHAILQIVQSGVVAYYCISAGNRCGNLSWDDVQYALHQMDAHCPAYEASWFRWPGSYEIVGKCRKGDEICI